MAYGSGRTKRGGNVGGWWRLGKKDPGWGGETETRGDGGSKSANVALAVGTPDGDYFCSSNKIYTDQASFVQEVDNSDGFTTISSFAKSKSTLTVQNAKVVLIKNVGSVGAEISISTYDWRNDGGADEVSDSSIDVMNSVDLNAEGTGGGASKVRTWTMLLPAKEFIYLPNSRIISYAPFDSASKESGANAVPGQIAIEPKDIYYDGSGKEYRPVNTYAGTTYASGAAVRVDGEIASTVKTLVVDDADWFEVGDLLYLGNDEVVEVEGISSTSLTIKRGLLGTTAATVSNNSDINYFFGNTELMVDNGKCQTDGQGRMTNYGAFYGYARNDGKIASGIVPGSVCIGPFYTQGGYLDFGLTDIKASDDTGLTAGTTYTFHIVVDEFADAGVDGLSSSPDGETAIAFQVDSTDTTFNGSVSAVIPKIQARFDELFYASPSASALSGKKVRIFLKNGDIRIQSLSNHSGTRIGIANISGTTPFSVGRFPVLASSVPDVKGSLHGGGTTDTISYGPEASKPIEEIENKQTGKVTPNYKEFIHDDGNGNLIQNNSVVGWIDYNKGRHHFTCPYPYAEYKVRAQSLSAHSGSIKYVLNAYNGLSDVGARSVNSVLDAKIELVLLG